MALTISRLDWFGVFLAISITAWLFPATIALAQGSPPEKSTGTQTSNIIQAYSSVE